MVNYNHKGGQENDLCNFDSRCDYWMCVWNVRRKELNMETYVTLTILLIVAVIAVFSLLNVYFKHEKKNFHSYDFPLDNKDKWWYN